MQHMLEFCSGKKQKHMLYFKRMYLVLYTLFDFVFIVYAMFKLIFDDY